MLIEIEWRPDAKKLRQFALAWLAGFALLGALAGYKTGLLAGSGRWTAPLILWGLAALVGATGLVRPALLKPLYTVWMALALVMGTAVSYALLACFYFLIFTPLALFFRLIGRDTLHRRFDRQAKTYWVRYENSRGRSRYFQQF